MDLHNEFDKLIFEKFKVNKLDKPVFYNFPIGIRYEIGVGKKYSDNGEINNTYIDNCILRTKKIFEDIFNEDDEIIMIIDSSENNENYVVGKDISVVKPLINRYIENICFDFKYSDDDDDEDTFKRYLYKTRISDVNFTEILEKIIWSGYGENWFSSSVFILNTSNEILYHLYDDRGLDIASSKISTIRPLYYKYNDWILDCDREKIDSLFIFPLQIFC